MPLPPTSPPAPDPADRPMQASLARAHHRAVRLVEMLLQRLEEGVADEAELGTAQWRRLFGSTQSAVVNLQKLVAALGDLPQELAEHTTAACGPEVPMTEAELQMLKGWLKLDEASADEAQPTSPSSIS